MKKILLLATGGTISCAESDEGLAPQFGITELLQNIPLIEQNTEITGEQLFSLDSTNMTPRHWTALAKRIAERYDEFDGFVITHGTATLGYAAAALSCLIQNSRKPIALTGSMLPLDCENSDAPGNLRGAVSFASADNTFGVCVVFGGRIIDGSCAVKISTEAPDAFRSVNSPDLGTYGDGYLKFNGNHTGETKFYSELCEGVYVAKLTPGTALRVPRFEGLRAVIVEGYGTGGIPEYCEAEIAALCNEGIYVIIATQSLYGGTDLGRYQVGRVAARRYTLLEAGKYTAEYAAARAQWALANSNDFEEFRRLFHYNERRR